MVDLAVGLEGWEMTRGIAWLEGFAPDVWATVRRFPVAIALAALATACGLFITNYAPWLSYEDWIRLFVGFACGAVCAVAAVFVRESRPEAKALGFIALYIVPLAFIGLAQVRDFGWAAPPLLLPAVAVLWLSVSPVTVLGRGEARERQQNLFWWINHQAIATAAIAGLAFLIIALGVAAIERSLFFLFGVDSADIFYRLVLPFTGLFLTPVYWLSTLPRASDYDETLAARPDFIASAVGFLGQFVLIPLLLIYAAILLAYTAMIAVTQTLPQGTIGWMVLGFVVSGAAAWLVLHPPFMRTRGLVRLFRRSWFWLTVLPLVLFFIAVWVRVDAYGLTGERILLIAGGVWAALLSAGYLIGRGDIRLIPALAGLILAVLAVGPWNYAALASRDQGARLGRLLALKADPTATVSTPDWNEEQRNAALSAAGYLLQDEHGEGILERVLLDHGFVYEADDKNAYDVMAMLGHEMAVTPDYSVRSAPRDTSVAVDVSATPYFVGRAEAWYASMSDTGLSLSLEDGVLRIHRDGEIARTIDLSDWASAQPVAQLSTPWIDFELEGVRYRLVVSTASWEGSPAAVGDAREVTNLSALLFASTPRGGVTPNP